MKFYKLNDTWVSWDELHNGYGYTTGPSIAVTYKSAHNSSSWGEDAGSGYYVGDIDDMAHGSFWCDSDYGWFELDGLVWNPEIYPSNATPLMMQNGGITSPAVSLESDGVTYYLIKVIVADTGWITADEAADLGWEVYDEMQGTFIVFDTVENKIVHAFTNELTYGEIEGIILQSPRLVYGVDISVPTAQFWFSANGRNEQDDSLLPSFGYDIDLYNEDGTRASGAQYAGAYPLAYMEVDGDMFTYGDDRIIINSGADLLGLESDEESNRSAWSVFAERVFTLSFANTQLPGITITMPSDETGYKGTSITLPTMTGEYESGGKTWKPIAWDIGAFDSSYTLNADTVAHLIFEEVQSYEEITLYFANGGSEKLGQPNITSSFTGNVNTTYVYPLYTDAEATIPWTGYDYSNDYEVGFYSGSTGAWVKRPSVSEMPVSTASSTSDSKISFILLDTGYVWAITNLTSAESVYPSSITVRIYPKDQQYYAAYVYGSSKYENAYVGISSSKACVNMSESLNYIQTPHQFPYITLQKILGAAGNEYPIANYSTYQGADGTRFRIRNDIIESNIRTVVYTLEYPTYYAWVNLTGDTNVRSGVPYFLMDKDGNYVEYDSNFEYYPIAMIKYDGSFSSSDYGYLNRATLQEYAQVPGFLCFIETYGDTSLSKVWYYRKPKS